MTTPSLMDRIRHGLSEILRRPHDPDRERAWALRESTVAHERQETGDSPVAGVRGSQPYDFGLHRRH